MLTCARCGAENPPGEIGGRHDDCAGPVVEAADVCDDCATHDGSLQDVVDAEREARRELADHESWRRNHTFALPETHR